LNAHILPRFGDARLRDIRLIHVEQFVADLSLRLSASRVRQVYNVLNASLKAAVRNEMVKSNPADGVKLPKQTSRDMLVLDPDQVKALANEVETEYTTLIYVLAYGGLRIGEARALRRSAINLMRGTIEVREAVTHRGGRFVFTPPKNDKHRVVTIPAFLRGMLETHLQRYCGTQPDALVFPGESDHPFRLYIFRRDVFKPALERSGIVPEFRIHDMRHTCASILINQSLHPKMVQEHLGHGSISITMDRYGHLFESDTQRLADALEAAFSHGLISSDTPSVIGNGESTADTRRTNRSRNSKSETRKAAIT
jgi:integrase